MTNEKMQLATLRTATHAAAYLLCILFTCLLACGAASQQPAAVRLRIAFVADETDAVASELRASLKKAGMRIRRIAPKDCVRESWWQADVVVVAWPKDLAIATRTPLERWDRPTVFVGSTGDRFAKHWDLPTAKQISSWFQNAGPELDRSPFEGGNGWRARQGNLVHIPEPLPKQKPAWLASAETTIRWASHLCSDQPMVRVVRSAQGIEAERVRVRRVHAGAAKLDVDVAVIKSLFDVPNMLRGSDQEQAETLLVDLFPAGPGEGAPRNDWRQWLMLRQNGLVWNQTSQIWHFDKLAYRRSLHGRARLIGRVDGLNNDPRAIALARKVVTYHSGQALDDLATFSCWQGKVHYMWDRRRGYFRMENHSPEKPRAGGKQWQVAAIDTASGEQVVWDRNRRVSVLESFQYLVQFHFMPLMLLDPGVGLRYIEDVDDDKTATLEVRLAGRNMNLATDYRMTIDRETGAILSLTSFWWGPAGQTYPLQDTISCGPLRLPATWQFEESQSENISTIEGVKWNPTLPEGIETAVEQLSLPRKK